MTTPRTILVIAAMLGLYATIAAPASMAAPDDCPNAAIRAQQNAGALPECRAYELVSTLGGIGETHRMPWASDDGNAMAYQSLIPGDDAFGGALTSTSMARRTSSGWNSVSADGSSSNGVALATGVSDPRAFTQDGKRAFFTTTLPFSTSDANSSPDFYRVNVGLGNSTWLSGGAPAPVARFVGSSVDLDEIVYSTATGPDAGLFLSDGHTTVPLSRNQDYPDGIPGDIAAQTAGSEIERGLNVPTFDTTAPAAERRGNRAVSNDARRVYFLRWRITQQDLFLRDLTTTPARTIPVSVSSRAGDVGTVYGADFISATPDGSQALFVSRAQLTDASTPGGGIYRFDRATETVTQITPDANDPVDGAAVAGAIASSDHSHLYFTARAALASGAQAGDVNAYVWTSSGGVRFIATVNPADPFPFRRVTADGRFTVMITTTSINGAANNGFPALYRYDDESRDVVCVSCPPDGKPAQGEAFVDGQSYGLPGAPFNRNRGLSADGRVLFMSTDPIVPADRTAAMDVYLYHDGKPSLLTTGREQAGSYIGDISDDGTNVSFITRSKFVGADDDPGEFDVYDARVDGGFPEPPAPSDPCRGDDCQGPPAPVLDGGPEPSSSRATGGGNVATAKAAKKLSMSLLSAAQRATLAHRGKVTIALRVRGGGKVSVRGRGRIGGRTRTVGSVSDAVPTKGVAPLRLTFRLSSAARRELSRRHRLRVTLEARLAGLSKTVRSTVVLSRVSR